MATAYGHYGRSGGGPTAPVIHGCWFGGLGVAAANILKINPWSAWLFGYVGGATASVLTYASLAACTKREELPKECPLFPYKGCPITGLLGAAAGEGFTYTVDPLTPLEALEICGVSTGWTLALCAVRLGGRYVILRICKKTEEETPFAEVYEAYVPPDLADGENPRPAPIAMELAQPPASGEQTRE